MPRLIAFNKPFNVLSQFRGEAEDVTLAAFIHDPRLRLAGRLDKDSEGLMLLSDDGQLIQQISHPRFKLPKTYLVQVEGTPSDEAVAQLSQGVQLNDGPTLPAHVTCVSEPGWLWPRQPPVRYRASIPTSWLEITITEGRNRQVRRMTAAVGLPTLRLIRLQIGTVRLIDLKLEAGQSCELELSQHPQWQTKQSLGHRQNRPGKNADKNRAFSRSTQPEHRAVRALRNRSD